jgi:hypothetical protein
MFALPEVTDHTGHTQKNGAVLIVNTIKTAPLFCVRPVYCTVLVVMEFDAERR